MFLFIIKVLVSSLIISIASWLSLKKPALAGFLIALPLMSIIAIFFSYNEHKNLEKTIMFSKRNEPNDYPENFSKTYVIKPRKKINNL